MINPEIPLYRPSDGDLVVPNILHSSAEQPTNVHKKMARRPDTTGSTRFGNLSHSSFFTRHNPHPGRVRHIKGLNDVPICAVNDDGYFPDARYKLDLPGDINSHTKFKATWDRIPVNAINVNSQLHPINTVTGLQFFTGLNSYPYREKAIAKFGMVPVTERWREELQSLTAAAGLTDPPKPKDEVKRPMYSATTGRLIPTPAKAMSRGASRRMKGMRPYEHITHEQQMENTVLQMLCQILQTDDVNAVQAWLISAGEQEKSYVLDLIKSAVSARDEYYRREPVVISTPAPDGLLPDQTAAVQPQPAVQTESDKQCEEMVKRIDRLSLDGVAPRGEDAKCEDVTKYARYSYCNGDKPASANAGAPLSEAFRPKPPTPTAAAAAPCATPNRPPASPALRYTKSPPKPLQSSLPPPNWSQQESTVN